MTQLFDRFARTYTSVLNQSLSVTPGLDKAFFDLAKLSCIENACERSPAPLQILDYGCGAGSLAVLLARSYAGSLVYGYDVSREILLENRARYQSFPNLRFVETLDSIPACDLVVVANVMHHVDLPGRAHELRKIGSIMARSAHACFFEHNPANPFARWVVNRCPFDTGVKLVWPSELRLLAAEAALVVQSYTHILHFPFRGRIFRALERPLGRFPLGAQYMMVMTRQSPPDGKGEH